MLPDDLELVGFGDYRQSAPCAMKLTKAVDMLDFAFLPVVAVECIRIIETDNPDSVSYFYFHFTVV